VNTLGTYVSYIRVNTSVAGPPALYLDPSISLPTHVRGMRKSRHSKTERHARSMRNTVGGSLFTAPAEDADIYTLPTLATHYGVHMQTRNTAPGLSRYPARAPPGPHARKRERRTGPVFAKHRAPKPAPHVAPSLHKPLHAKKPVKAPAVPLKKRGGKRGRN